MRRGKRKTARRQRRARFQKNPFIRIAIHTSGGDTPGLNAVIHAVVHAAHTHGWKIHGIRDGYGLLHPENYPDGGVIKLTRPLVCNIAHLGGTILGTSNHGYPFKTVAGTRA